MRAFFFLSLLTLAHSAALPPPSLPALLPRAEHCANAPSTLAGSPLPNRLRPRAPPFPYGPHPVLWCSHGASTFVSLVISAAAPEQPLLDLFFNAYADITNHLHFMGDGVVHGGSFTFPGQGVELKMWSANNHQATFGVLASAVMTMWDYMNSQNHFGFATFDIFDGPNQVGSGSLGSIG